MPTSLQRNIRILTPFLRILNPVLYNKNLKLSYAIRNVNVLPDSTYPLTGNRVRD